jgi:rhodanese-related sulfurtransferase
MAVQAARAAGMDTAYHIEGGMKSWKETPEVSE